jgi:hypothetical protein
VSLMAVNPPVHAFMQALKEGLHVGVLCGHRALRHLLVVVDLQGQTVTLRTVHSVGRVLDM